MEIKKTFRFYEHLSEEAFLNEQLKKGYALSFVEQNNYHFKEEKKPDNVYYRIAYYAKQQDLEVLKQAFKAVDVLEAELGNMGGYYYYLLLTEKIVLKDDREYVLKDMKGRLENFNLSILVLLGLYFIYKYIQNRHLAYLFFIGFNVSTIAVLLRQIYKIRQALKKVD